MSMGADKKGAPGIFFTRRRGGLPDVSTWFQPVAYELGLIQTSADKTEAREATPGSLDVVSVVYCVRGGSVGRTMSGCLPVSVFRKAAIFVVSSSESFTPSWASPITPIAFLRSKVEPVWK